MKTAVRSMSIPGNVLLDSNIVIAHFRRDETASEKCFVGNITQGFGAPSARDMTLWTSAS